MGLSQSMMMMRPDPVKDKKKQQTNIQTKKTYPI